MGISKATAAQRMTEVPKDITAQLVEGDSQGRRALYEFNADKYGTVKVRVYLPDTIKASALNGIVLDYDVEGVLAEDVDDLNRARKLRARSVLTFDGSKHTGFTDEDSYEDTALVVLDFPDWAEVETLTLAA